MKQAMLIFLSAIIKKAKKKSEKSVGQFWNRIRVQSIRISNETNFEKAVTLINWDCLNGPKSKIFAIEENEVQKWISFDLLDFECQD